MFSWEGEDPESIAAQVTGRDPRRYRTGVATAAGTAGAPERVVVSWFSGRSELGHFLARAEPRLRGVSGLDYIRLRDPLQQCLTALEIRGTDEPLRAEVSAIAEPAFTVLWWGTLETLREGTTPWARELLQALDPPATPPLPAKRTGALIELLQRTCGRY